MKELFDRPAIVKQADVRAELAPKIRMLARKTEEDQLQIGKWLIECKEACIRAGDDWFSWLDKETGIPERTARYWMAKVNNNGQAKENTGNIAGVLPEESQIEQELQQAVPPSVLPTSAPEREPGCDDDVFDAKDEAKDQKRREANKPTPPKKDAIGQTIPACQKDVFGDALLPESIAWLQEAQDEAEKIVERLKGKILHYPFVLVKDAYQHLDEAIVALQLARESLTPGVPYAVCGHCKGKGCEVCRKGGHLPQWRFDELKQQEAVA